MIRLKAIVKTDTRILLIVALYESVGLRIGHITVCLETATA